MISVKNAGRDKVCTGRPAFVSQLKLSRQFRNSNSTFITTLSATALPMPKQDVTESQLVRPKTFAYSLHNYHCILSDLKEVRYGERSSV